MCALAMELTLERHPKVIQKSLQLLISYWQWIAFAHCISLLRRWSLLKYNETHRQGAFSLGRSVPLCTQSSVRWCTPYPCSWHPACPTGSFLDQMLHSNVWRRLRQMLAALPCPCCDWLHRAMFFSVILIHRIAPEQPMMCHDTSYYIMIFPNSSDARWRMAAHQFFKFPRWAWQQAAHVGTLWGLLGGLPKKEKSWARWDMIMSHLGAGLEYYVMTNSYPKYVIVKYCQWMININYVIPGKSVSFTNKPWLGVLAVHFG